MKDCKTFLIQHSDEQEREKKIETFFPPPNRFLVRVVDLSRSLVYDDTKTTPFEHGKVSLLLILCSFFCVVSFGNLDKCFLSQLSFSSAEGINVKSNCLLCFCAFRAWAKNSTTTKKSLNSLLSWLVECLLAPSSSSSCYNVWVFRLNPENE